MNIQEVEGIIRRVGARGRIFRVTFVKRTTGELRDMNCRLGVTRYLRGGELPFSPKEKNLIIVYDVKKKGYRSISLDNVHQIVGGRQVWTINPKN